MVGATPCVAADMGAGTAGATPFAVEADVMGAMRCGVRVMVAAMRCEVRVTAAVI
jgi:hypothetical protein